jgi:hypothetical protein
MSRLSGTPEPRISCALARGGIRFLTLESPVTRSKSNKGQSTYILPLFSHLAMPVSLVSVLES